MGKRLGDDLDTKQMEVTVTVNVPERLSPRQISALIKRMLAIAKKNATDAVLKDQDLKLEMPAYWATALKIVAVKTKPEDRNVARKRREFRRMEELASQYEESTNG